MSIPWCLVAQYAASQAVAQLTYGKDYITNICSQQPPLFPDYQPYLQLLDCYFEAFQHRLDPEERFALAQVITDTMHRCPRFDLSHPYFSKAYQDECICPRLHLQLVRSILNEHVSTVGFSNSACEKKMENMTRTEDRVFFSLWAQNLCFLGQHVPHAYL